MNFPDRNTNVFIDRSYYPTDFIKSCIATVSV